MNTLFGQSTFNIDNLLDLIVNPKLIFYSGKYCASGITDEDFN